MTKLWQTGKLNKEIEKFTVGNDYLLDKKLLKYDCIASIAHAKMLKKIGILTENELSFCEKTNSFANRNKIIINEVAWMGTKESSNDEWLELKNISGKVINLSDWQLLDKDKQIKIIFFEIFLIMTCISTTLPPQIQ